MVGSVVLTRKYLIDVGGWAAVKEAAALQEAGKVIEVALHEAGATSDKAELSGRLQLATGTVAARLTLSPRLSEVENHCPCRQSRERGQICAHVLALGLAWIARQTPTSTTASPTASRPTASPSSKPPTTTAAAPKPHISRIVPWSDTAGDQRLTPAFLLPLELAAAWRERRLRVILEAELPGKGSIPWDAALKAHAQSQKQPPGNPSAPLAIADGAVDALRLIEERHQGTIPGIVLLDPADYDRFFESLIGYSGVWLGKKSAIAIRRSTTKPKVQVTTQADGKMRIEMLATAGPSAQWLPSARGQWSYDGQTLEQHPQRGPILQRLGTQPVILPASEVPHFLQLPSLAEQVEIELCPVSQKIEWRETKPRLHARLDGSLATLTCHLEARYEIPSKGQPDSRSILLSAATFTAPRRDDPARWLPAGPGLYLGRDGGVEEKARTSLTHAGFIPLPRHAELHQLAGESAVIDFLADHLPTWRRNWEIELTPRLAALIGQCEVIAPRVEVRSAGNEWLSLETQFRSGDGSVVLSAGEVQQLLQTGRNHKRLGNGKIALIPAQAIGEWQEVLTDCDSEAGLGATRVHRRFSPYLEQVLQENGLGPTPGDRRAWTAPDRIAAPAPLPTLPPDLETILRPYQKEGVAWLHTLASAGLSGILADEMGLGKTLQVLAYLMVRRNAAGGTKLAPALVIAPTTLLVNWQREAARFTPALKTAVIHGGERHALWDQLAGYDLLITSYALLRRDLEHYLPVEFDAVILDEAQHIKNRFSQNAQAVKELQARCRMILTGTPLENSLLDLWSMFDFLMPGYLGPAKSFRDRYETPIAKQNDGPALKRLRQRVHPFLLRRTKQEVAKEIPEKIESLTYCELTAEQREVYRSVLEQGRREVFEHSGKQGNAGRRTMAMLTTLTRLRQACCHLDLLPLDRPEPWKEPSAKLDALFELIDEAADGGHRILVFSQFVKLLQLIALRLQTEKIAYCYLDGSTRDRQAEIDRFQTTPAIPLFLISLKAGGTGLNLTAADTVIHCDPWWNPAVEDQATARAHRIGQQRVVSSYKLIARDTVEEKIVQLQEKKKDLIAQTLLGEEALLSHLTQQEWEDLLAG